MATGSAAARATRPQYHARRHRSPPRRLLTPLTPPTLVGDGGSVRASGATVGQRTKCSIEVDIERPIGPTAPRGPIPPATRRAIAGNRNRWPNQTPELRGLGRLSGGLLHYDLGAGACFVPIDQHVRVTVHGRDGVHQGWDRSHAGSIGGPIDEVTLRVRGLGQRLRIDRAFGQLLRVAAAAHVGKDSVGTTAAVGILRPSRIRVIARRELTNANSRRRLRASGFRGCDNRGRAG